MQEVESICNNSPLQVGKDFDALLIDTSAPQGHPVFDVFDKDTVEVASMHACLNVLTSFYVLLSSWQDMVMKFVYLGEY